MRKEAVVVSPPIPRRFCTDCGIAIPLADKECPKQACSLKRAQRARAKFPAGMVGEQMTLDLQTVQ